MVNSARTEAGVALALLGALEAGAGDCVSGGQLGRRLKVSRACIWKHVQALRRQGYEIRSECRKGYRLLSAPERITPLAVQKSLVASVIGREVHCFDRLGSTQDVAFRMAQKGAPEGTVVLAEEQSGGRGRLGRSFYSPRGGLWFSVILRPPLEPQLCLPASLMAGVAVSEAIAGITALSPVLKWPNDILLNGRKAAGMLAEIVAETDAVHFLLCGIGINVNIARHAFPAELTDTATSLSAELGREVGRTGLLCAVLERLDYYYQALLRGGAEPVLAAWKRAPNFLGRQVSLVCDGKLVEGVAEDLDGQGALLVRGAEGMRRVVSGEVRLAEGAPTLRDHVGGRV